jgi:hypothetical protein
MSLSRPLSIAFDVDLIDKFDEIADRLSQRACGASMRRTAVIKLLIKFGMEELESRLDSGAPIEGAE